MFYLNKTKRNIVTLFIAILAISLLTVAGCNKTAKESATTSAPAATETVYQRPAEITTADAASALLVDGNKRFTSGSILKKDLGAARRAELAKGQKPFAVILTCSDSRVPPELFFDQALGDLFVIRVAGNVVSPIEMGSIEYGVEHLGAPLVVVLGHESCGAVKATVDGGEAPGSIGSIVEKIKPSVEKAKAGGATGDALYEKTADENINAMIAEINKSPIIKHLEESGKVKVVGAKYFLTTGEVVFNAAAK